MDESKKMALVKQMREEDLKQIENITADLGQRYQMPTRSGERYVLVYPASEGAPAFFNIHGGGFVAGKPELDAGFCDKLHRALDIWVFNLDYRLAPETVCPGDKEDILDLLEAIWKQQDKFPFDRKKMAIGGHSAGGNIATTVCRMLRDQGSSPFLAQVLNCPPLDFHTPANKKYFAEGAVLPESADIFDACYRPEGMSAKDPALSPLWQPPEELTGMPDALVISAENDSLREEAEDYARTLMRAGVEVTGKRFPGKRHAFACSEADGQKYMIDYLKRKLCGNTQSND